MRALGRVHAEGARTRADRKINRALPFCSHLRPLRRLPDHMARQRARRARPTTRFTRRESRNDITQGKRFRGQG